MADESGFSQQDPSDAATEYNAQTFVMRQLISEISTIKNVKVIAVNTAAKTVDVRPMVNQVDGNNRATPHGTIYGIPYGPWQFGKNAIIADPAVGDKGIMGCADRDISAVKATKDIAPPGSNRKYNAADGIYLGGLLNDDPDQWVKFTDTGIEVHDKNSNTITTSSAGINWHDANDNALISNAAGISINGVMFNRMGQVVGNLPVTGNFQLGGSFQALAGSVYAGNITITGTIQAADFKPTTGPQYLLHKHNTPSGNSGTPI